MGGHSLTSRSNSALLGSNGDSSEATAKRVAVLLFHFRQGRRCVCQIDFQDDFQDDFQNPALGASPARFDSLSAVRLWAALSDAERDALALPMPSGKNPRLEAGMEGGSL